MKFKVILLSALLIVVMAGIGIGGYMLWPAIQGTITGNRYYTANEAQNLYDQGYSDGAKSETELTAKVDYYKTLVDEYYIQVDSLTKQSTILQNENIRYSAQITDLTEQKNLLENELSVLRGESIQDKNKIIDLETEIDSLNAEITKLELTIFNNDNKIGEYEDSILKLQTSVSYYENYIANLETENQVVATFEFNGSVYNVQILNKGGKAMVADPTSTEYVLFNGWTVDGELVDLNTYMINTNTKFIADVSYRYTVEFSVDSTTISTQLVAKDLNATSPAEAPTKSGYVFKGWSVDGTNIIDVATYTITKDTKFIALFEKVYTATFQYENEVVNTQIIERGTCAENVVVEDSETKLFAGWTVNGELVDVNSYVVTRDTVFIAKIDYKYLVTFTANNEIFATELVLNGTSANIPTETPIKSQQTFKGWSIDGVNVIDVSTISISGETNFIAVFGNIVVNDFILTKSTVNGSSSTSMGKTYYSVSDKYDFKSETLSSYDVIYNYEKVIVSFDYNYDYVTASNITTVGIGEGVGSGHVSFEVTFGPVTSNGSSTPYYYVKKIYDNFTMADGYVVSGADKTSYNIEFSGDETILDFQTYNRNGGGDYWFEGTSEIGFTFAPTEVTKTTYKAFTSTVETLGFLYVSNISNVQIELIP